MRGLALILCFVYTSLGYAFDLDKSVVRILDGWSLTKRGTGFFVKPDLLVTNHHVIQGTARDGVVFFKVKNEDIYEETTTTTESGATVSSRILKEDRGYSIDIGEVVAEDVENDLALIRTRGDHYKPLSLATEASLQKGDRVFTINLRGEELAPKFHKGVILNPTKQDEINYKDFWEFLISTWPHSFDLGPEYWKSFFIAEDGFSMTAQAHAGDSGAPVWLAKSNKVIGVAVAGAFTSKDVSYHPTVGASVDTLQALIRDLESSQNKPDYSKELMSELLEQAKLWKKQKSMTKKVKSLHIRAVGGRAQAQFELGLFRLITSLSADLDEQALKNRLLAFRWMEKASIQQQREAQYVLAIMHREALARRKKNPKQARFWMQKAADQGLVRAKYMLGKMYFESKSYKQAYTWLLQVDKSAFEKINQLPWLNESNLLLSYWKNNKLETFREYFEPSGDDLNQMIDIVKKKLDIENDREN